MLIFGAHLRAIMIAVSVLLLLYSLGVMGELVIMILYPSMDVSFVPLPVILFRIYLYHSEILYTPICFFCIFLILNGIVSREVVKLYVVSFHL